MGGVNINLEETIKELGIEINGKKILTDEKEPYIPFIEFDCKYDKYEFTVFVKLDKIEIYHFYQKETNKLIDRHVDLKDMRKEGWKHIISNLNNYKKNT